MTGTIMVAHIGRKHAENVSKQGFENSVRMKRIEKQEEVLLDAAHLINRVSMSLSDQITSLEALVKAYPSESEVMKLRADLEVYGSDDLRTLTERWVAGVVPAMLSLKNEN